MTAELEVLAFDCFGTVFDMEEIPRSEILAYVQHVRKSDFSEYQFPESWRNLKAHEDAADAIASLKVMGFRCVAFSNGGPKLIKEISGANSIQWDDIFDPCESKAYKPSYAAYRWLANHCGDPSKTLIVTANPRFGDIFGAQLIGAKAWVVRTGHHPSSLLDLAQALTI